MSFVNCVIWCTGEWNYVSHTIINEPFFLSFLSLLIALFFSYILVLRSQYYDTLRMWLEPRMAQTGGRWLHCYRAVDHGFGAQTFREKCKTHGATVTLVKVGKYVFGGFADQRWGGK